MKAVGYQQSLPITDPNSLMDIELPKPQPQGQDLLVKVEAVSVNPVDTKVRKGVSPDSGFKVLGWDATGVVEQVGDQVTLFKPGDRVWYAGAIDRPGTNAEYHLVDQRIVGRMPTSLDFTQAAALPLTALTAWELLFDRFALNTKHQGSLLVMGGAGGVGSILIQLAKKLTSLKVIATASRPESQQWVKQLGANEVVDHSQPLAEQLAKIGDINWVASLTQTQQYLDIYPEIMAAQGKLAVIDDPGQLDIMAFKRKSISVHWELMFTRSLYQTQDMIEQHHILNQVADLVDEGTLKTTHGESLGAINADNLRKAHEILEAGTAVGKLVLTGF